MSIHTWKAYGVARQKSAWGGALTEDQWIELAAMNKRELIEIALHLGFIAGDHDALEAGEEETTVAFDRIIHERNTLHVNGMI